MRFQNRIEVAQRLHNFQRTYVTSGSDGVSARGSAISTSARRLAWRLSWKLQQAIFALPSFPVFRTAGARIGPDAIARIMTGCSEKSKNPIAHGRGKP